VQVVFVEVWRFAERLDVPLGTIKARTARGLRRLGSLIASPAALLLIGC